ncbi:MAG TPA: hypothetical protein VGK48_01060 [Terriglobia bacterium]|jgi:hypothetical protein
MISLIMALLLFQSTIDGNIRALFGRNFNETMQNLDEINAGYLKSQGLSSTQISSALSRLKKPSAPSADNNVVVLDSTNAGTGLFGMAPKNGIAMEQINIAFCGRTERAMAIEILLRNDKALGADEFLLQMKETYGLPDSARFDGFHPAIQYPLAGISYTNDGNWQAQSDARPVTVWSAENLEAVFQPTAAAGTVDGQLWIVDKMSAHDCAAGGQK